MCLPHRALASDLLSQGAGECVAGRKHPARNRYESVLRESAKFAQHALRHCKPTTCSTVHGCVLAAVPTWLFGMRP